MKALEKNNTEFMTLLARNRTEASKHVFTVKSALMVRLERYSLGSFKCPFLEFFFLLLIVIFKGLEEAFPQQDVTQPHKLESSNLISMPFYELIVTIF